MNTLLGIPKKVPNLLGWAGIFQGWFGKKMWEGRFVVVGDCKTI
jgi:hypothetical protein